jgi:hypothetical protein
MFPCFTVSQGGEGYGPVLVGAAGGGALDMNNSQQHYLPMYDTGVMQRETSGSGGNVALYEAAQR